MDQQTKPLSWWMKNLTSMSRDVWLWIPADTEKLTFDTLCTPIGGDDELSEEEQDRRDVELKESGLKCFFFKDQLEHIELNLKAQKYDFTQDQLLAALNYYWENDAFIDLKNV